MKKYLSISLALLLSTILAATLLTCGGGGGGSSPVPNATITGKVDGTVAMAIDENGVLVDSDDTADKTADADGKYSFTLTCPIGRKYRIYFIVDEGTSSERFVPLYDSSGTTNVFSISVEGTIDLKFVDCSGSKAVPTNDPLDIKGVTSIGENTIMPGVIDGSNWQFFPRGQILYFLHFAADHSPLGTHPQIMDEGSEVLNTSYGSINCTIVKYNFHPVGWEDYWIGYTDNKFIRFKVGEEEYGGPREEREDEYIILDFPLYKGKTWFAGLDDGEEEIATVESINETIGEDDIEDLTFPIENLTGVMRISYGSAATYRYRYLHSDFPWFVKTRYSNGNTDELKNISSLFQLGNWSALRLVDDESGEKGYTFAIRVKGEWGSILTDESIIQDVKILAYPSLAEVPLSDSWNLWYSEYKYDSDGNGPKSTSPFNWSEVNGSLNVPVGSLAEGFYKGVITLSSGGQFDTWLYYETPVEVNKVQGSSMKVIDNEGGTVTLSWTNPENLDSSRHVIRVYIFTTEDSGDGFDDALLLILLPPTENSYTIPASEVTRLKGYSSLYWYVQIRDQILNVNDPEATTKSFYVYRNYGPSKTLTLPLP